MARWSARHDWKKRVAVHEADAVKAEADRDEAAAAQAALEKAREVERRRETIAETAWELSQALFAQARLMLRMPIVRQEVKNADGVVTTIVNPVGWKMGDAARIAEVADGLARIAVGMPQTQTAATGPLGEPLPPAHVPAPVVNVTLEYSEETKKIKEAHGIGG